MALSQELKDKFEKVKAKKAEIVAQKAMLDQQQVKLYADIRAKGIEPEQLPAKVKELQEQVASFEADAGPKLDKVLADLASAENASLAGDVKQGDFAGHLEESTDASGELPSAGTGLPPEVNFG